jgi:hypothetical protein
MKFLFVFLLISIVNFISGFPLNNIKRANAALTCKDQESAEVKHKIPIIGSIPIIGPQIEEAAKPFTETLGAVVNGVHLAGDVIAANIPTPKNMKIDFPNPLDLLG